MLKLSLDEIWTWGLGLDAGAGREESFPMLWI